MTIIQIVDSEELKGEYVKMSTTNETTNTNNPEEMGEMENQSLHQAMKEVKANQTPETMEHFVDELKKAELCTPGKVEDGRAQFQTFTVPGNGQFIMAFTTVEELKKEVAPPWNVINCTFNTLAQIVERTPKGLEGIIINSYGEIIVLPLRFFADLKMREALDSGKAVFTAEIDERADEVKQDLTEFFDAKGTVEKAYLRFVKQGDIEFLVLIIDNEFPEGGSEEEWDRFNNELPLGENIVVLLENYGFGIEQFSIADYRTEMGEMLAEGIEPFYTR